MNRIVILTQYYAPEMGAPQSRLSETAIGLKQLGWDVRIVTAMPNYPTGKIFPGYKRKLLKRDQLDGILVYRYALYASNSKSRLPRIASMLSFSITCLASVFSLMRFKPDYILTESPPLTLAAAGVLLARVSGARHIMNVSDIWPLSARELGAVSDGLLYKVLKRLETRLYKSSFACTGQSQQIADYLKINGSARVHLFRNGVDSSRFNVSRIGRTNGPIKIVYAGLLGVAQGILSLVQNINFKEIDAEFHLYGDGAERKLIQSFLQKHPGTSVFLHGAVHKAEMPAILSHFDLTIIPLVKPIYGAVPSKIYEAMAAGLPILFAGGGEGAQLIQQFNTGWVCEPSDFIAMKETIRHAAKLDAAELARIRRNCLHAAKQVFDRQTQVTQLSQFLQNA